MVLVALAVSSAALLSFLFPACRWQSSSLQGSSRGLHVLLRALCTGMVFGVNQQYPGSTKWEGQAPTVLQMRSKGKTQRPSHLDRLLLGTCQGGEEQWPLIGTRCPSPLAGLVPTPQLLSLQCSSSANPSPGSPGISPKTPGAGANPGPGRDSQAAAETAKVGTFRARSPWLAGKRCVGLISGPRGLPLPLIRL